MKSKQILSIDLDYIMEPCIKDYERLITKDNPRYITITDNMQDVFDQMHLFSDQINKYAEVSLKNLEEIFEIFLIALKNSTEDTEIYFAHNHDTILKPLQKIINKNDRIDLFNIDHHHDIFYSVGQQRDIDNYDLVSPADWVWFLDKNGVINSYHWVGNSNSDLSSDLTSDTLNMSFTPYRTLKECTSLPPKFDLIYVCCSPHWTPKKFLGYFNILKNTAEAFTGKKYEVDTGYYCGAREAKPFFGGK